MEGNVLALKINEKYNVEYPNGTGTGWTLRQEDYKGFLGFTDDSGNTIFIPRENIYRMTLWHGSDPGITM